MASESVLKSFVVSLGFKVDQAQFKRFQESMGSIGKNAVGLTKSFVQLGAAVGGTAVAAAVGLNKIAKPLESLYFAAQRTGASANELKSLTGAFEQIGVSADEAQEAIESFAQARRTMPGIEQILGIDPRQKDNTKAFIQTLSQLANGDTNPFTHAIVVQKAGMAGISEQMLTQFENNRGEFIAELQKREKIVNKFDVGKMAKTGHQFNEAFRDTATNVELTADKIATGVMPAAERVLGYTDKLADLYNKIDDRSGGWLGHLSAVAGVSSSILTTYKAIAALRGFMGGAAVAEGAGAAASAGGGLAATIGGIVAIAVPIVIGAVAAYELYKHKDAVEAAGKSIVSSLPSFVGNKTFDSSSIAAFVAGFEGHVKNGYGTYKDIAGHQTAGFGHLVRPGEDFSGLDKQGALSLLAKDLQSAGDSVKKLVHVALSGNQMKALTDLVFNIGEGNFKKSALLAKLNAGDYAGADAQFQYWNKAMQGGHLLANEGLTRRRAAEAQLFRTPDKHVTINQKTDIHIEAGPNAGATADRVAKVQGRGNGDLVRNFAGATS